MKKKTNHKTKQERFGYLFRSLDVETEKQILKSWQQMSDGMFGELVRLERQEKWRGSLHPI